jgi:hypothetical protein
LRMIVNPFLAEHARELAKVLARDVRNIVAIFDTLDLDQLGAWVTPAFHRQMELHRVYSMTTRPDNVHLWKHYAGDHTGYCLEFQNNGLFSYARTVIYGDEVELDFCNPDAIDATFLFRKTRRYADEEEVRILLFPRGQPHEVSFDATLLRRVILGNRMAAEHRRVIREWCGVREPTLLVADEIALSEER